MATARRQVIAQAFDKAHAPPPVPKVQRGMSLLQIAGEVVRQTKDIGVGGMTRVLYALPDDDRARVTHVANLYANHRDAGRHGRPEHVAEAFEVDPDIAEKVVDGLEVDYVARELMNRRGTDADLPMPELTRRDHIDAAIHAHTES